MLTEKQRNNGILFRRTGIGITGNHGAAVLRNTASIAGKELKWRAARIKQELEQVRRAFIIPKHGVV